MPFYDLNKNTRRAVERGQELGKALFDANQKRRQQQKKLNREILKEREKRVWEKQKMDYKQKLDLEKDIAKQSFKSQIEREKKLEPQRQIVEAEGVTPFKFDETTIEQPASVSPEGYVIGTKASPLSPFTTKTGGRKGISPAEFLRKRGKEVGLTTKGITVKEPKKSKEDFTDIGTQKFADILESGFYTSKGKKTKFDRTDKFTVELIKKSIEKKLGKKINFDDSRVQTALSKPKKRKFFGLFG